MLVPAMSVADDGTAIVGTWTDGHVSITLTSKRVYRWEELVPCASPPCPVKVTSGQYAVRGTHLYLSPPSGNDQMFDFKLEASPARLTLSGGSAATNLVLTRPK